MRVRLAMLWVAAQVVFFLGWAGMEEHRMAVGEGKSILVKTAPVDPRDLLRGQYLQLAYEFSGVNRQVWHHADDLAQGGTAWVVLEEAGAFYVPHALLNRRPGHLDDRQVAMRGRVNHSRLEFGIEKYFVPEGSATPDPRDITVRLRVGADGKPRIEAVYVADVPWPDRR